MIDLRLGDWRDVLADVECDALICDPPYSARTHQGHYSGCTKTSDVDRERLRRKGYDDKRSRRRSLTYAAWSDDDVVEFVGAWSKRCRGWMVVITDDILAPTLRRSFESVGRYAFAPLPFVEVGKCPRLTGDGPASWTCWIVVSRPRSREFSSWGSLPGSYVFRTGTIEQTKLVVGGKPERLMTALVRDYSRPNDIVCDPFAGGATTLQAAIGLGRKAVGAEIDPETHAKAMQRLERGQMEMTL